MRHYPLFLLVLLVVEAHGRYGLDGKGVSHITKRASSYRRGRGGSPYNSGGGFPSRGTGRWKNIGGGRIPVEDSGAPYSGSVFNSNYDLDRYSPESGSWDDIGVGIGSAAGDSGTRQSGNESGRSYDWEDNFSLLGNSRWNALMGQRGSTVEGGRVANETRQPGNELPRGGNWDDYFSILGTNRRNPVGGGTRNTAGDTTRNTAGDATRNTTGDTTRNTAGDETRNTAGDATRNTAGVATWNTADDATRNTAGDTTQNTAGDEKRNTAGDATRNNAGDATRNNAGDATRNTETGGSRNDEESENAEDEETRSSETDESRNSEAEETRSDEHIQPRNAETDRVGGFLSRLRSRRLGSEEAGTGSTEIGRAANGRGRFGIREEIAEETRNDEPIEPKNAETDRIGNFLSRLRSRRLGSAEGGTGSTEVGGAANGAGRFGTRSENNNNRSRYFTGFGAKGQTATGQGRGFVEGEDISIGSAQSGDVGGSGIKADNGVAFGSGETNIR